MNLLLQFLSRKAVELQEWQVTVKSFCRDAQSRWLELASDSQFIKQSGSHQQAFIVRQPGPQLMSKAPFSSGWTVLMKRARRRPCADSDGLRHVLLPAPSFLPIARPPQRLSRAWTQSSIQSFCLDRGALGLQMDGGEEKGVPVCLHARPPGKAWGLLAPLTAWTRDETQIRKVANGFIQATKPG